MHKVKKKIQISVKFLGNECIYDRAVRNHIWFYCLFHVAVMYVHKKQVESRYVFQLFIVALMLLLALHAMRATRISFQAKKKELIGQKTGLLKHFFLF